MPVSAAAYAVGTLTAGANATSAKAVTIGAKTYTFKSSLASAGDVKVGADAEASLANLYNAINLTGTAGTDYHEDTVLNPDVVATAKTDTTVVVKSKVPGTVGNLIPTTSTDSNLTWGGTTLASGTGSLATAISELLATEQLNAAVAQALLGLDADSLAN